MGADRRMESLDVGLNPAAWSLRPCRVLERRNEFRLYEEVTFPGNPWRGCEWTLRQCKAVGYLVDESDWCIDVLDEMGDLVQEFRITRAGFEFLRRRLKFRVNDLGGRYRS